MGVRKSNMDSNSKTKKFDRVYQELIKACKRNKLNVTDVIDKLNEYSDGSENDVVSTDSVKSDNTLKSQRRSSDPDVFSLSKRQRTNDFVNSNRFDVFSQQIDEDMNKCEDLNNLKDNHSRKAMRNKKQEGEATKNDRPNQSKNNETKTNAEPAKTTGKSRVPPIMVTSVKTYELSKELKKENVNFTVKISKNENQVIRCEDIEGHRKLFNLLKERKVECHTYTPKTERKGVIILKGVHHLYPAEEIEVDIMRQCGVETNVKNLETQRSTGGGYKLNLHVVTTNNADDIKNISKLSYICHHKIGWEKQKNNNGIVQCIRCQRFGHISKNCAYQYRCVKCKVSHEPYKCEAPKKGSNLANSQSTVYCTNCQQFGHPANYRGCSELKKLQEKVRIAKEHKQLRAQNKWSDKMFAIGSASMAVKPGLSYATVATLPGNKLQQQHQEQQQQPNQVSQPSFDFISSECRNLFNVNFLDLLKKINNFVPQYKNISDRSEKQSALINFMFEICLN